MVERGLFQMTLWKRLGMKYTILYPYEIPLTIPILECILKRNELTMYKDSIYFIYFKLSGGSFPYITTKEYDTILNTFNAISNIYDKYKPNDRKSFLNYSFVLKKLLIMLGKVGYAKCTPTIEDPLKAERTGTSVGTNN